MNLAPSALGQHPEPGLGALSTALGNLPLTHLDIFARVVSLVSTTTVRQRFYNSHEEPIEAVYIFPLPDRAAVTSFTMTAQDHRVKGVLRERSQARKEYAQAISAGKRAALAEEDRPDCFTMSVGNIPPRTAVDIELELTGPLTFSGSQACFRFPLVVAQRYIPGVPLSKIPVGAGHAQDTAAVPDASRVSPPTLLPGFGEPVHLSLSVQLCGAQPPRDLSCGQHEVEVTHEGDSTRVALRPGERVDRDFILRYTLGGPSVEAQLTLLPQGEETTFIATVSPPTAKRSTAPQDIVFVLDRSGSMEGAITIAQRALSRMIAALNEGDRFTVFAFDNTVEAPFWELRAADASARHRAMEFVANTCPRGGTELIPPLERALSLLGSDPERPSTLVLITDAQVGNEDQLLRALAPSLKRAHVHSVGIGSAVAMSLLHRLADLSGGRCEQVESEQRLDEVMTRLQMSLRAPILSQLELHLEGAQILQNTRVPRKTPDLFDESPILFMGRLKGAPTQAKLTAVSKEGPITLGMAIAKTSEAALTKHWARGQVRALEDERLTAPEPERSALARALVETSLQHGVLCRFTAFVAISDRDEPVLSQGRRVVQPVQKAAPAHHGTFNERMQIKRGYRSSRTQSGVLKGKFFHMSPEQVRGEAIGPRSDIFALGLLLFEMCTGERLFQGESDFDTLRAVSEWSLDELQPHTRKLGDAFVPLRGCLAPSPKDRFSSAMALLHTLSPPDEAQARARLAARVAPLLKKPTPRPLGRRFGDYELLAQLVADETSTFYLGEEPSGALVQLKIAQPHVLQDPELSQVFLDEAMLQHPNLEEVLDRVLLPTQEMAVVLAYHEGITWSQLRRSGPLPVDLALFVIAQLANALVHLGKIFHPQAYVHRQLDAENVQLGADGSVRLLSVGPAPDQAPAPKEAQPFWA